MFGSATLRLSASYLAIIMAISIVFSVVLYKASTHELQQSFHRETIFYQIDPGYQNIGSGQFTSPQDLYNQARGRLELNLVLINLGILVVAGAAAYVLARRTLTPIESALEAQSRFASDASHELRTPLTAMKSEIEVALRAKDLPKAEARELLQSNLEEIGRLEALSAGLLKLARQDKANATFAACSLEDVSNEVIKRLGKKIAERDITIKREVGPIAVMGDRESLVELFVTLVDNAVKYSDPKTTITMQASLHGKAAFIDVIDQGHGIKAVDVPHIFDRFYRADTSRTKQKIDGYGLGLSIAKQIVDLHDGSIGVASRPGEGATFTVKLPAA